MKKMLLLATLLLVGCNEEDVPNDELQIVAQQLSAPWAIDKHDGTFYVTERTGAIVAITGNDAVRQQVILKRELSTASEAGLLGFVLSPQFADTNEAFAYYTYEGNGQHNRIVKLQLDGNMWHETDVLLDNIPSGAFHHGGRLKLGEDGHLYATAGDASNPALAQQLDSLGGKILRLTTDGDVPSDNPFDSSYVFSYGHRNPQGLAWREDELYASEHGQQANDEINAIIAANNYGWPLIEGQQQESDMETPLFTSGDDTWAPSGMAYYNGELYIAALRGEAIFAFSLDDNTMRTVVEGVGRIRDVYVDEDTLYFITNNTDGRGTANKQHDILYALPF